MEMETAYLNPHFMGNPNNWVFSPRTGWTREENKQFERALAVFDKETPERWFNIAATIPGKSVLDVMSKYKELEQDLIEIEAGRVPIPWCFGPSFTIHGRLYDGIRKKGLGPGSAPGRGSDQERKKGIPWTEEEHRRFLQGLMKYGKGEWRSISRDFVVSKTPTQVASHAQKYFIRQQLSSNSSSKDTTRRRPSIHDITTHNLTELNNPDDSISQNLNHPSSTGPFPVQKPDFDLTWLDVKLQSGPGFGVQPSRSYRIYG